MSNLTVLTIKHSFDLVLYNILLEKGSLTRDKLVDITKRSRTTIYDSLSRLELKGLITKRSLDRNRRKGRGSVVWETD